jgi:hypothetical protein
MVAASDLNFVAFKWIVAEFANYLWRVLYLIGNVKTLIIYII